MLSTSKSATPDCISLEHVTLINASGPYIFPRVTSRYGDQVFTVFPLSSSKKGRTRRRGGSREPIVLSWRGCLKSWNSSAAGKYPSKLRSTKGSGRITSSPTCRGLTCARQFLASWHCHGMSSRTRTSSRGRTGVLAASCIRECSAR